MKTEIRSCYFLSQQQQLAVLLKEQNFADDLPVKERFCMLPHLEVCEMNFKTGANV